MRNIIIHVRQTPQNDATNPPSTDIEMDTETHIETTPDKDIHSEAANIHVGVVKEHCVVIRNLPQRMREVENGTFANCDEEHIHACSLGLTSQKSTQSHARETNLTTENLVY